MQKNSIYFKVFLVFLVLEIVSHMGSSHCKIIFNIVPKSHYSGNPATGVNKGVHNSKNSPNIPRVTFFTVCRPSPEMHKNGPEPLSKVPSEVARSCHYSSLEEITFFNVKINPRKFSLNEISRSVTNVSLPIKTLLTY